MLNRIFLVALTLCLTGAVMCTASAENLRPYLLVSNEAGALAEKTTEVKKALEDNGFEIVGEHTSVAGAHILIVTNDALKATAAKSTFGGYGAALRVGLREIDGKVQVSHVNPAYMANIYRMDGELADMTAALAKALGEGKPYGSEDGFTAKDLRKYHYMMMMPYFDDHIELASYDSHDAAVKAVEAGLKAKKGGTAQLYKIEVPGKEEVLYGVSLANGEGADTKVMTNCDTANFEHTCYLPYEMLVSGGKVYCLHGKFRIALSFPDLSMGTFMKIRNAPSSIAASLKAAAQGE